MSVLTGNAAAPITVRRYADERVVLDGNGYEYGTLTIRGAYTRYWGLEVMNSNPTRFVANYMTCYPNCRPSAIEVFGPGTKIINNIVHDAGGGIGLWQAAIDAEAYGNIVFYSGWESDLRGHGHAIYTQNDTGTKRIVDNILFSSFHTGIHAYGSSAAQIRNFVVEGNVIFNNGLLASNPNGWGILVGGANLAQNITIRNNYLYNPTWFSRSSNLDPSYGSGSTAVTLTGNHSSGNAPVHFGRAISPVTATGNTFYGNVEGAAREQISSSTNTFAAVMPSTTRVFLRRNQYDPNLTTVVVFNGARAADVAVDLSSALAAGDTYEIRDVQNYLGTPMMRGSYAGTPVRISLNGTAVSPTSGATPRAPVHTSNEFGTFIVRKIGTASAPAPTPTPAPAPTPTPTPSPTPSFRITLEPEDHSVVAPMDIFANRAASSGRYAKTSMANSGFVEMRFSVPASGTYAVWARVMATGQNSDTFRVSFDGAQNYVFQTMDSGWSGNFVWVPLRRQINGVNSQWNPTLNGGTHNIRFTGGEVGTMLDAVLVTDDLNFRP